MFNQFGELERCSLRPGNVHSADGWGDVVKPVVARYQGKVSRLYFRADAGFTNPDVYEFLEAEKIKYAIRLPANHILQDRIGSGGKLEQTAPGGLQDRVACGQTLSARRLHRNECEPPSRAHVQVDPVVMPNVRGRRSAAAASCARLQPRQFPAHAGTPEPIKDWSLTTLKEKLIKIGAEVVSHGRYVAFQMAEVTIPRQMSQERPQPSRAPT